MGSRRIMLVKPGRYSPATEPFITRPAPAKKRNTSAMAGISSFSAAASGLPQFCDSSAAKSWPSASMRSASFSSSVARSFGTVAAQPAKAFDAALTAATICSSEASATCVMTFPVDGLSTFCSSPLPLVSLPLMSSFVFIVGPREVISEHDWQQRHGDHDDRHHVGDGPVAWPEQFVEEPDGQRTLVARGEYGDDDFIEGQCERQHAAGEKGGRDLRQQHVTQRLRSVGAQVHGRLHPVRRQAAQ